MNVTTFPKAYGSAFREACFVLANVNAPGGVDVEICSPAVNAPLGVKRIYAAGEASVNVAPYARGLLAPGPLCGCEGGTEVDLGRTVPCYVEVPGFSSSVVSLTGGTEDAPEDAILSVAPAMVKIAPGEKDEISVLTSGRVKPLVVFRRGSLEYTDSSMKEIVSTGMVTTVIDMEALGRSFSSRTGLPVGDLAEFKVRLRVVVGGVESYLERHYTVDHSAGGSVSGAGRRLAWVNRYGAIDYYTFPTVGEERAAGSRTRIETPGGYRTVATSAVKSETLLSEPCDPGVADWLAEIFSSPAVWTIRGASFEKAEVSGGVVESSPLRPAVVSVKVSPAVKNVSRKL